MIDIKIAKPCDQSWTAMKGDERVRHCQSCNHNVYNIAEMTEAEVEELVRRTEGRFCARVYRRTDNRVMTRDCPKGVATVRRRVAVAVTAVCAVVFYGVSLAKREPRTLGQARVEVGKIAAVKKVVEKIDPQPVMDDAAMTGKPVMVTMGFISGRSTKGKIAVIPKRR